MARKGKKSEQENEARPRSGSVEGDAAPGLGDPDGTAGAAVGTVQQSEDQDGSDRAAQPGAVSIDHLGTATAGGTMPIVEHEDLADGTGSVPSSGEGASTAAEGVAESPALDQPAQAAAPAASDLSLGEASAGGPEADAPDEIQGAGAAQPAAHDEEAPQAEDWYGCLMHLLSMPTEMVPDDYTVGEIYDLLSKGDANATAVSEVLEPLGLDIIRDRNLWLAVAAAHPVLSEHFSTTPWASGEAGGWIGALLKAPEGIVHGDSSFVIDGEKVKAVTVDVDRAQSWAVGREIETAIAEPEQPRSSRANVFAELLPGARAMHAAEAAAMAVTAGLAFPCRFDAEIYSVLDISPDIPAEALLKLMTSDVYPFRVDAAEALKATYVGMQPWVKAENARLAEAAKPPPGRSRYEKAGERVGKVGERVLDDREKARIKREARGMPIGDVS